MEIQQPPPVRRELSVAEQHNVIDAGGKYLGVCIYKFPLSDCTLGGASALPAKFFVRCSDGNWSGSELLEMRERGDCLITFVPLQKAIWPCEPHYVRLEVEGDTRGKMAGGNFAYTSDSRFGRINRYPVSIHDRVE